MQAADDSDYHDSPPAGSIGTSGEENDFDVEVLAPSERARRRREARDAWRATMNARAEAHEPSPPPGPLVAYQIPQDLYEKAWKHQDQLTEEERHLFLSRGDLVGRALAQPSSLTPEEA